MKCKNIIFIGMVLLSIALYSAADTDLVQAQSAAGVVLVAHGSNNPHVPCNQSVLDLYNMVKTDPSLPLPPENVKLAYLRFDNLNTLNNAVAELRARGINRDILFVHLAPSSYSIRHIELTKAPDPTSTAYQHWLYRKAIKRHNLPPLPGGQRYAFSPAMDDNLKIVHILSQHAQQTYDNLPSPLEGGLPKRTENVSLMLVSYGAIEELENILWDRIMEGVGETIRGERKFKEVACVSLRNHSADLIREQAIRNLIKTARRLKEQGEVIVVPYVLCGGAFHENLKSYLTGIVSAGNICSNGILSDLATTKSWVLEMINQGMNQPNPKKWEVNRNWSVMDIEQGSPMGTNKYGED